MCTCCRCSPAEKEGPVVGRFFESHVPEVAHAFHGGMFRIAADRGGVAYLAQVECLVAVQRFENDGRAALYRVIAQLAELVYQVVAGVHRVRHCGNLPVESRNHDDARRAEFAGRSDDLAHRLVELLPHRFVFRQNEALETGADRADLDVASLQQFLQFADPCGQAGSAGSKPTTPFCSMKSNFCPAFHRERFLPGTRVSVPFFFFFSAVASCEHVQRTDRCDGSADQRRP